MPKQSFKWTIQRRRYTIVPYLSTLEMGRTVF